MNPVNRRDFLKAAGGALAATALTPAALAADKRPWKKGIMWGGIGGKGTVLDKFKMAKDAGLDGIQMDSGMNQTDVLKARDATGVLVPSVCDSVHWGKPLSDPDPAVRAAGLEGLNQSLRDAKAYGATAVLLVPGVVNEKIGYADAWERSQAEIRKAIPLAEDLGMQIAFENVWNNFILSPMEARYYVDSFNSQAVGWWFDIGNVGRYGWADQWIRILDKRAQNLHFKEFSKKKMEKEGLWAGFNADYLDGDNDWPAIMKALDDVGYKGWAIAEPAYTPPGVEPAARLHQIAEKLDRILAL